MSEKLSRKSSGSQAPALPARGKLRAVAGGKPAEPTEKRLGRERRNPQRSGQADLPRERSAPAGHEHYLLPHNTRGMAAFLLGAYAAAALVANSIPGVAVLAAVGLSVMLVFVGSMLAPVERRIETSPALRLGLVLLTIVTPMAAVGFAFAQWVLEGLEWQWAVATVICTGAAAAVMFEGRIIPLFAAKIAMWAAFALVDPQLITLVAVAGAMLALLLIARLEWASAEKRRLEREARERVAARAEDILRSFEESGQGWFWETDRRGLITYISPKAAAVLGKSSEELRGRPLSEIVDSAAGAAEAERTLAFHLSARSAFQVAGLASCPLRFAHRARQPRADGSGARADPRRPQRSRTRLRGAHARSRPLQAGQRHARPSGR